MTCFADAYQRGYVQSSIRSSIEFMTRVLAAKSLTEDDQMEGEAASESSNEAMDIEMQTLEVPTSKHSENAEPIHNIKAIMEHENAMESLPAIFKVTRQVSHNPQTVVKPPRLCDTVLTGEELERLGIHKRKNPGKV